MGLNKFHILLSWLLKINTKGEVSLVKLLNEYDKKNLKNFNDKRFLKFFNYLIESEKGN